MYDEFSLSEDGSHIIASESSSNYIFDRDGEFIQRIDNRNIYDFLSFSKTEFWGTNTTDDYSKTNLVAVDFVNDTEKIVYEFNCYVSDFYINSDASYIAYNLYPKWYGVKLKGDKKKFELLNEVYTMSKMIIQDDKFAIVYSPNYNSTLVSLYQEDNLLWKHSIKSTYIDISQFSFVNNEKNEDELIMIENSYTYYKVHKFGKSYHIQYTMKTIRNISFHYPKLSYIMGTKELWVQDMKNTIRIYYFETSIAGMLNENNSFSESSKNTSLGLILESQNTYQIAEAFINKE